MNIDLQEDILYGEPVSRPKYFKPKIENQKLAIEVTVICRDEFGKQTGETYTVTIEHGCRNCLSGALATTAEPCVICYKKYTPERPYCMWQFDPNYHPCDEIFI